MEQSEIGKMIELEDTHWWYASRRELLRIIMPKECKHIFEVGSGTGKNLEMLRQNGFDVEGIEPDAKAVKRAMKRELSVKKSTLEDFTFRKKYDAFLMADVLEHIEDDVAALKKIRSALKPDGKLVLVVPAYKALFSKHDELCRHYRRYERAELVEKLSQSGFTVKKCTYWNFFLFPIVALVKILKKSTKNAASDVEETWGPLNWFFGKLLGIENLAIKSGIELPFGVSIICVAEKK